MRILKFGGKSLETLEKVQNVCKLIKNIYKTEQNLVIVVSAMGDTTQKLTRLAEEFGYKNCSDREMALLLSTGEIQSASLFCMSLQSFGVPALAFTGRDLEISTFGDYLNARVCYLNKAKINECFKNNKVAVVCGFQGINNIGETVTLGLGGSDTTAAAIAAAFNCPVEIYSDFSGVFAGDPRILSYKKIKKLNYSMMLSLANSGAKVLDAKAVDIAKTHSIKIISKSTYCPNKQGTEVFNFCCDEIGISEICGLCKISVSFSNKQRLLEICNKVLKILKDYKYFNLCVLDDCISFYVAEKYKTEITFALSNKLKLLSRKK